MPPATVTALVESAVDEPSTRVPAVMLTSPVKVLRPASVNVPAVVLAKPRVPSRLAETAPVVATNCERLTVPLASSPPATVKVLANDNPFRSNTPPRTLTALSVGMASRIAGRRVPPVTVVAPV